MHLETANHIMQAHLCNTQLHITISLASVEQ